MPWERRAKRAHTCNRPDRWQIHRKQAEAGDTWRCRKCGARWELTYPGIPATNLIGPATEPQWTKREPRERLRQTGTDWLSTVREGGTEPDLSWITTMPVQE